MEDNFSDKDCPTDIMEKEFTMADIKFLWTYKKGDKTIDMGYMNTELVKSRLFESLEENGGYVAFFRVLLIYFIFLK